MLMCNESIRRIVWIMVDGVSAAKIRSCCNPEENAARNSEMPPTFFDELAKESFVATHTICSGPYTQVAMGGQFTGLSPHEHGMNAHYKYSKFLKDKMCTLPARLIRVGWNTYFATNSVSWIHELGPRDYPIPLGGFEVIDTEPSGWDLAGNKTIKLWHKDPEKGFLFIHDWFQHHRPEHNNPLGILKSKTYEKIIYKTGENLRQMLQVIGVSKDDLLGVSSDHGMTIDSGAYAPHRCANEGEWSLEMKEVHIRNLFMVRHKTVVPISYKSVLSDQYVPKIIEIALHGDGLTASQVDTLCDKKYAISSGGGNFAQINNKCFRDDYGEQIFSLRNDMEKWICQPNIGPQYCEYYDLSQDPTEIYPKEITFSELPTELRRYIAIVQNSRFFWRRLWLYIIASKRKTRLKKAIVGFKGKLFGMFHVRRD